MKIKREDKRVRCINCYYAFWADRYMSIKFIQCPRCNNLEVELEKEYGKPIYKTREYEYYTNKE